MYHKISVKPKNLTSKFQFSNRKFLILFAFACMWIYMKDSLMQLWILYQKIDTFALRVLAKQMERIWRRQSQIYRFHQRRYYLLWLSTDPLKTSKLFQFFYVVLVPEISEKTMGYASCAWNWLPDWLPKITILNWSLRVVKTER